MNLISWNVNGLRSLLGRGLLVKFMNQCKPDCLCIQETKARDDIDLKIPGYEQYFNHAQRPGYAGTAILTKVKPIKVACGIGRPEHDEEGRVITAEFNDFYLVNVYVPNSGRELARLPYRYKKWDVDFLKYLKRLGKKKPVVFCGDLNVAHKEIDLTNPKANVKNHGFTPQERAGFDNMVKAGFLDTFREFEKGPGHYTWWSQFNNCRQRNIGWRIDYFLISPVLRPRLKRAYILKDAAGSDHCPVGIELDI